MGDQQNNTGIVFEVTHCETNAGIDDNEDNVNATLAELLPCVRNVTRNIDFDQNGHTPIYLGATAGMRLLELKRPAVATLIFEQVKSSLGNYTDEDKVFSVKQVRTLSGQEEGLFAWIAANFLLTNFNDKHGQAPKVTVGEKLVP